MTTLERAFEAIALYAENRVREVNMPGLALAVTDRERLLRVATFGHDVLAAGKPVQPGTMLKIGAIRKSFTNFALLQLRHEGLPVLPPPMSCYLPWFEAQSGYGRVTTHPLMIHTVGLPTGID